MVLISFRKFVKDCRIVCADSKERGDAGGQASPVVTDKEDAKMLTKSKDNKYSSC
jgi:hypothetical protein